MDQMAVGCTSFALIRKEAVIIIYDQMQPRCGANNESPPPDGGPQCLKTETVLARLSMWLWVVI